jgi:hypothetical protein
MSDQNLSRRGFLKLTGLLPGLPALIQKLAEDNIDLEQEFDESACRVEGQVIVGREHYWDAYQYIVGSSAATSLAWSEWKAAHRAAVCPIWPEGHSCSLCTEQPWLYER